MTEYAAKWRFHLLEFAIRRLLKTASHEAAGELKPEAYPQGYLEGFGGMAHVHKSTDRLVKTPCGKAAGSVATEAYP
ncbi:MAG TPA: hypothetical protein PK782_17405, partial [Nitrospira sp.]|nr:hypothetical protein [Nitrospira sp.]